MPAVTINISIKKRARESIRYFVVKFDFWSLYLNQILGKMTRFLKNMTRLAGAIFALTTFYRCF